MFGRLVSWLLEPLEGRPESKCSNCGSEISLEALTCVICGYTISHTTSSNEHLNREVLDAQHSTIESLETMKRKQLEQRDANFWYEKARSECKVDLLENSFASLQKAIELDGAYANLADITVSHVFQPLRKDPRFRELVRKRHEELEQVLTSTQS